MPPKRNKSPKKSPIKQKTFQTALISNELFESSESEKEDLINSPAKRLRSNKVSEGLQNILEKNNKENSKLNLIEGKKNSKFNDNESNSSSQQASGEILKFLNLFKDEISKRLDDVNHNQQEINDEIKFIRNEQAAFKDEIKVLREQSTSSLLINLNNSNKLSTRINSNFKISNSRKILIDQARSKNPSKIASLAMTSISTVRDVYKSTKSGRGATLKEKNVKEFPKQIMAEIKEICREKLPDKTYKLIDNQKIDLPDWSAKVEENIQRKLGN
jgi:hypothetical protein